MKSWEVKTKGKLEYLLIFTVFSVLFFIYFVWRGTAGDVGSFMHTLEETAIGAILFYIAWLVTFPAMILKRKIPGKIRIDPETASIEFSLNKKNTDLMDFKDLAFSYYSYRLYNVIIFHRKAIGTRGNMIYGEYLSIMGMTYGFGWKRKTIQEIYEFLDTLNIEHYQFPDKIFINRLFR